MIRFNNIPTKDWKRGKKNSYLLDTLFLLILNLENMQEFIKP